MDQNMEMLLAKLQEKLNQQTVTITKSVTENVLEALDEKIKHIVSENKALKSKVTELEQKINFMEKDKRKNNLIFFGTEEAGKSECELVDYVKEIISDMEIHIESSEINTVYRIGRWTSNSINRPIVVSFTTTWKKHLIMKNKASLPSGIYIKEDFPKEVLEKRKQLQLQVVEEKKKGNLAFLKYDKLIIKTPSHQENNRDKRKREESSSPTESTQKKSNAQTRPAREATKTCKKDVLKPSIFKYADCGRSAQTSEQSKN